MSEVRRRNVKKKGTEKELEQNYDTDLKSPDEKNENTTASPDEPLGDISPESYWLTRIVFLRYLGFIYFIAFIISFNQNKELIGSHGLTPASNFLLNGMYICLIVLL